MYFRQNELFASFIKQTIKKDAKWVWTTEYQEILEKIKGMLESYSFVTHYDPKIEIFVATDAGSYGRGTCIMHKHKDSSIKRTAHASRTLLPG